VHLAQLGFNTKVAFGPSTLKSTVYIDNCAKQTFSRPAGNRVNYFKNGVYSCASSVCKDHDKSSHLFTKPYARRRAETRRRRLCRCVTWRVTINNLAAVTRPGSRANASDFAAFGALQPFFDLRLVRLEGAGAFELGERAFAQFAGEVGLRQG